MNGVQVMRSSMPAAYLMARRRELRLLLLSFVPVTLAGLTGFLAGKSGKPDLFLLLVHAGLFLLASLVLRLARSDADPVLLPLLSFLTGISLLVLARLDPFLAHRQSIWLAVSLGTMTIVSLWAGYPKLERWWPLALLASLALAGITLVAGVRVGGARAWLRWGGFQFQPVEPIKLLFVLFFAGLVSDRQELDRGSRWVAILGVLLLLGLVVLQRDLGSAFLLVALFVLLAATVRDGVRLVWPIAAFAGAVLTAAYLVLPYVTMRIEAWLDPWRAPHSSGYQTLQALYALGSGGLFGSGVGLGSPERIPAAATDYLLAAWGEEGGFLGLLPVLVALLLLVVRGLAIARQRTGQPFLARLTAGGALLFAAQGFIIAGGIVRLLPLTGLPFPFFGYGGSSLLVNSLVAGILLAHSRGRGWDITSSNRPDEPAGPEPASTGLLRHRLLWLGRGVMAAYVILIAGFSYWQVVQGPSLAARPDNPRLVARTLGVPRGGIYDRRDRPLAEPIIAVKPGDKEQFTRRYDVDPTFGPHLGYLDPRLGLAGLEASYSSWLVGEERSLLTALGVPHAPAGAPADLFLTLDGDLQRLAGRLLRGRPGAAVVLDPRTGAIRVLASSPGFNPETVGDDWDELRQDPLQPLFPRAVSGRYAPGSAWKPLVLAAALDRGVLKGDETFDDQGAVVIDGNRIANADERAWGRLDLDSALAVSSNVVFAQIGAALPPAAWMELLGPIVTWNGIEVDRRQLPVTPGSLPPPGERWSRVARAEMGIGQGPLALSPLALAVGTAAIANGGWLVTPYLVEEGVGRGGTGWREPVREPKRLFSAEATARVRRAMRAVVVRGTGRTAEVYGEKVAGKTGTANGPGGREDAWFVGFAPYDEPRVVVVVVIEGGGAGGRTAAPVARELISAALASLR